MQSFDDLKYIAERGVDGSDKVRTFSIDPSCEFIEFTVLLDVKVDGHYRWSLFNHKHKLSPAIPFVRDELPFALMIPVDYLAEGLNTLRVSEVLQPDEVYKPDTFNIEFIVSFSD